MGKPVGKTKKEVARRPEKLFTELRSNKIETSRKQRRMAVFTEGSQGPEGAVAP
jgi:hypothetical protein